MTGATGNLHPDLVAVLGQLERRLAFELHITSGHREKAHNAEVGGVPNSEHTYSPAKGADVRCLSSAIRYKMLRELFSMAVRRIGIGDGFVHVGVAMDKPLDACWTYPDKPPLPPPVTNV
jgi:uncharacterized protein YcbK (DUF882 family)